MKLPLLLLELSSVIDLWSFLFAKKSEEEQSNPSVLNIPNGEKPTHVETILKPFLKYRKLFQQFRTQASLPWSDSTNFVARSRAVVVTLPLLLEKSLLLLDSSFSWL